MTTESSPRNRIFKLRTVHLFVIALMFSLPLATTALADVSCNSCVDNSDPSRTSPVMGKDFMIAAAHPAAVQAGCDILKAGGTAIDAAIAAQAVLAVVEPQSSGLAGGSLITYWDNDAKRARFFEGLSRAPAAVTDGLRTLTEEDKAQCTGIKGSSFSSRVEVTGRAFGVPGTLRVLEMVHDLYGKKAWSDLFEAGIHLAENGFPMSAYMHTILGEKAAYRKRCYYPDLGARYCDGNTPKAVGAMLYNAEIAQVMYEIRDGGADAFYDPEGTIAPAIIDRVGAGACQDYIPFGYQPVANVPSLMTVADFAAYTARERDPVCREVFGHIICSAAPPAFGGTAVLYMLELMEQGDIEDMAPGSLEQVHLFLEASRMAQADRRQHVGDPDYNFIPVRGLLDKDYLTMRFDLYDPDEAIDLTLDDTAPVSMIGNPPRGVPIGPFWRNFDFARRNKTRSGLAVGPLAKHSEKTPDSDTDSVQDTTSHISIVDLYGNALSMTTTNNKSFGTQMEVRGMILNNVQANFTRLNSISPGKPANIMESMKRARTSVAPTLVFKPNGRLKLVVGAAGGGAIPDYVAQTILNVVVYGMDPQEAINQAHMSGQSITSKCGGVIGARSEVEAGTPLAELEEDLKDLGHPCARNTKLRSGLTAISIEPNGTLFGAADPRRDGIAMGE